MLRQRSLKELFNKNFNFHRFLSNRHDSISIVGCISEAQKLITARLLAVLTVDVMREERSLIHFLYMTGKPTEINEANRC